MTRLIAIVMVLPFLILGRFGGNQYLLHDHVDHGVHLHGVSATSGAPRLEADHSLHHHHAPNQHPPGEHDTPEDTDGTLVNIPSGDHLPTRAAPQVPALMPVMTVVAEAWCFASLELVLALPRPGLSSGHPLDLCLMSAGERLVRTSSSLLL